MTCTEHIAPLSDIAETGDWSADNHAGRTAAAACVRHIQDREAPHHLCVVARQILTHGRFGGVEVGFFTALGMALLME